MDFDFEDDYDEEELREMEALAEQWQEAWEEFLEERIAQQPMEKCPLPTKFINPIDRGSNPREQRYIDSHWSFCFTLTETDINFLNEIGATWEDVEARACDVAFPV